MGSILTASSNKNRAVIHRLLHFTLIFAVVVTSMIPLSGGSAGDPKQRIDTDKISSSVDYTQPLPNPDFFIDHTYQEVLPDYHYATQILQADSTGTPCSGLIDCTGIVQWFSTTNAIGIQDGADAKLINSSHTTGSAGLRACMVVLLEESVHIENGIIEAYVHQPQGSTQDMGMEMAVADAVLPCNSPDWNIAYGYREVGTDQAAGWYGGRYTGDVKAIRIQVWSGGGNGFCIAREFYIDAVRVYGIPATLLAILDRSSLSQNNPKNGPGDPRECAIRACGDTQATAGDPIDIRTGNFDYSLVDLTLHTVAGPLTFQRSYASQATDTGLYPTSLGPGWTHNQDNRLIFENGLVWFKAHTHNQYQFTNNNEQTFTPYPGVLATLTYDQTTSVYTLINSDQSIYTFNEAGLLQSWRNEQGFGFDYSYNAGKLFRVTEPISGRYLQFNYLDNVLDSVNDPSGRQVSFGYDSNGDLVSFIDTGEKTWTYTYESHRLTQLRDPEGQVYLTNVYDLQGRAYEQFNGKNERIIKIVFNEDGTRTTLDALEHQSIYGFDGRGVNIYHTDLAGYTLFREYDSNFRLTRVTDQDGNASIYTWSSDGANLNDVRDAGGYNTHLVYDDKNHLIQAIDPHNQVIDFIYTGAYLTTLIRHTHEWGDIVTGYEYTTAADAPQPFGLLKTITDSQGNITRFFYDDLGQLTTLQDAASSDTIKNETHLAYDTYGRITDMTDPMGRVTHYEYDPAGNTRLIILNYVPGIAQDEENQYNLTTEFIYDDQGRMVQVKRLLDETKAITNGVIYDRAGRIYQTLDGYDKATTYTYLPNGQVQTITDPLNHAITYVYDAVGRLFQAQDASGRVTQTYTYNPDSTVSTAAIPTVHTLTDTQDYVIHYQYDFLKRIRGIFDNNGHTASTTYNAYGSPLTQADGLGRVTKFEYNELGLLKSVTQNFNSARPPDQETNVRTGYAYNVLGQLTTVTDANGHTTQYEYDPLGRLKRVVDARQKETVYDYDLNGNRTSVRDANGDFISFENDLVNRLHSVNYPGGSVQDVLFWYDALGRVTGMDDSLGHTGWVYNDQNRILEVTDPYDRKVGYGYDDAGKRTHLTYPNGRTISYQYNATGQLERVLEETQTWAEYNYDPGSGRITSALLANGIRTSYGFDYSGQLTSLVHQQTSGETLASYRYQYDAAGNRIQASENITVVENQQTPTPTASATPTNTSTATAPSTATPTPTDTPTPTQTSSPTPTLTHTPLPPTLTGTPTRTNTPSPAPTKTP